MNAGSIATRAIDRRSLLRAAAAGAAAALTAACNPFASAPPLPELRAGSKFKVAGLSAFVEQPRFARTLAEVAAVRSIEFQTIPVPPAAMAESAGFAAALSAASADPVDVIFYPLQDQENLVSAGRLAPLEQLAAGRNVAVEADYWERLLVAGQLRGRQYGIPVIAAPWVFMYNVAAFAAQSLSPPASDWSWSEFRELAARLSADLDGDGQLDRIGFLQVPMAPAPGLPPSIPPSYAWILANGGALQDASGSFQALGSAKSLAAVRFMADLIHRDRVSSAVTDFQRFLAILNVDGVAMISYVVESGQLAVRNLGRPYNLAMFPRERGGSVACEMDAMAGVDAGSDHAAESLLAARVIAEALQQRLLVPALRAPAADVLRIEPALQISDKDVILDSMAAATPVTLSRRQKLVLAQELDWPVMKGERQPEEAAARAATALDALA